MQTSKPQEGIIVSQIDKYIVSFFFDDKGLKLSLINQYHYFFFFKFSMKLKKIQIFILQFDLGNPRSNLKLFFHDVNFLPAALAIKD